MSKIRSVKADMNNATSAQSAPELGSGLNAGLAIISARLLSTRLTLPVHTAHRPSAITSGTKLHAIKSELKIFVDDRLRLSELHCDGALVATPAGSTAYNYSAHGPILPIGCEVLAITAMAAFRPRRWRGAVLPKNAKVRFEIIEPQKRPVMADADSRSVQDVVTVEIESAGDIEHRLLFDPGHGLEERLIQEQFA